jgi:hypothetical protein
VEEWDYGKRKASQTWINAVEVGITPRSWGFDHLTETGSYKSWEKERTYWIASNQRERS